MGYFPLKLRKFIFLFAMLARGVVFADAVDAVSLRLTWSDNSNDEVGFRIERKNAEEGIVQLATVGANVTSFTDAQVMEGRAYCYSIRAFNVVGLSDPSNSACVSVPAASTTPNTPGTSTGGGGGTGQTSTSGFNTASSLFTDSDSGSTRGSVMKGDQMMIGGFVIEGPEPTVVLVRGRGPSMGDKPFGVSGTLSNPQLQLFSASTPIAANDNWQDSPECDSRFVCGGPAHIVATGLDPCRPNPGQTTAPSGCTAESAILMILPPGAYTAVLSGVNGGTGVGLVEVFEIDGGANPSRLVNVSTRAVIKSKDDVMIGGVILAGNESKTVLIRGRGPSMAGAPFFVAGTLSNPQLQLYSGSTLIAQNDNWQDGVECDPRFACGGSTQVQSIGMSPCEPNPGQSSTPPGCNQESVLLITLPPGAYTAILRGVGGATGVALVEMFDLN